MKALIIYDARVARIGIVRIDGRRQIAVTDHRISTFFDVYLKGGNRIGTKRPTEVSGGRMPPLTVG